jgi:autotransporter-associated beta strand protein
MTSAETFNSLKLAFAPSLSMTGTGALTLTSGGLICTGSTCAISGGTISAPSGELIVDTATNLNISSVLSASAALTKTGTATLTLTGLHPIAGSVIINQGTLAFAPTANLAFPNIISGAGNLLMAGTGTKLTLGGSDTYTGRTSLTGGTLCVNGSLAGGGPVNLQSGTVLTGSGSILGNVTANGATIVQDAGGLIAGSVTLNSGTLTVGQAGSGGYLNVGGGLYINGSSSVLAGSTSAALSGNFYYTSTCDATFTGNIFGATSSVTLNSPAGAVLTLAGSNQYGGGTFLYGGTLKTANPAALADGNLTMTAGTLDLDASPAVLVASLSGGGGIITNSSSGKCTLSVVGPGMTYFSGGITDGNGNVALTLSGGSLILYGSNTYTGGTTVLGGLLSGDFPAGTSLIVGAAAPVEFHDTYTAVSTGGPATPVPEPGTIVLLLAALWSAEACRRFSKRPALWKMPAAVGNSRGAAECNSLGREPQEPIQNDILAAERRYTRGRRSVVSPLRG